MWGAFRRFCRALAIVLAALVAVSGCGDDEPASDRDDEQVQELEQLLESGDAQELLEEPELAEPVAPRWPHCAAYRDVLEAITRADSAEPAIEDAQMALEEAGVAYLAADAADDDVGRFDAEQNRLNSIIALADAEAALADAMRTYESAADAAVASAEALVADTTADNDARSASQNALEAYAAVVDAADFAAHGQTSVALGTPAYDAAYELALTAALVAAPPGRVTAEARVAAAENTVREARLLEEEAPAAAAAAWAAAAEAQAEYAETAAEAEAAAYAAAEQAAAAALAEADMQAAVLEAIALISVAVGETDDYRADVAYQAAWEAAYDEAEDSPNVTTTRRQRAARQIADMAARDAAYAAQAALVVRLDALAAGAGLVADIATAHQAAMSAWIAAWSLAEEADWEHIVDLYISTNDDEELDRAAELVFDRQSAYDDRAYRAAARAVRTAVADSVPSAESVAAAEAEDAHWTVGGSAHRAFVAARDRIAAARAGQRGRIHPGTDLIAWDAYHVALDLLESTALAEAADIWADATISRPVIDIESDPRVVQTRAAAEQSVAAAEEFQAAAEGVYEIARQAEAELAEAQAELAATQPAYDRAVRAAWKAVAAEAGCR